MPYRKRGSFLPLALFLAYGLFAFLFFLRARPIQIPLIVTDAVQYRLLAENLHRYGDFLLRGYFPTTIQPLYSIVLFLFEPLRSLFPTDPNFYQAINALLFAAALFPLYGLARTFSFSSWPALGLAALTLLLPHSFYVATCMSENLYFPLLMTYLFFVSRFLQDPRPIFGLALGLLGGLFLLTKAAAAFVILSFVLYTFLLGLKRRAYFWLGLLTLGLSALVYFPWLLTKMSHLGASSQGALGVYSSNWLIVVEKLLSPESARMFVVYFADLVLATGFVCFLPVVCYFLTVPDEKRREAFYFILLALVLLGVGAFFSGLNTGWLRERHFFVVFPLFVLLFFYVLRKSRAEFWSRVVPWTVVFLLLCDLLLGLYDFNVAAPHLESPWINLVSVYFPLHLSRKEIYLRVSYYLLPFVLLVALLLHLRKTSLFVFWFVFFFVFPTQVSFLNLYQWNQRALHSSWARIIRWVKREIGTERGLLVAGRHAYFEPTFLQRNLDPRLVSWVESLGLKNIPICRLEMAGLYDVRMVSHVEELKHWWKEFKGEFFLTNFCLSQTKPLSVFGPLRLYRISGPLPKIVYETSINPFWFYTRTGKKISSSGPGQKIKASRPGWAVFGPYWTLPRGSYRLTFLLECLRPSSLILDVYANSLGSLVKKELTCYQEEKPSLSFVVKEPKAKYEFRLFLKQGGLIFEGMELSLKEAKNGGGSL